MIVWIPRPSSPTSRASAPSSRISADALERFPSLSFSRSIRKPGCAPFEEEARDPGRRLREHEERVGHRRRAEPLVPVELPGLAAPARGRLVRADVGAALPLGHRHPAERVAARQPRNPFGCQLGLCAQGGYRGEGHRERAADACFDLPEQHEQRRPGDVRPRLLGHPRQRLHVRLQTEAQQRVPGRVELDLVDPLAVAVVRAEHRRMLVREPPPLERLPAQHASERGDARLERAAALTLESLGERPVLRRTGRSRRAEAAGWPRSGQSSSGDCRPIPRPDVS